MQQNGTFARRCYAPLLLALGCLLGCGRSADEAPAIEGLVTLDGKPLDTAGVTFIPASGTAGQGAVGLTDKEGKFVARSLGNGQRRLAGKYKVTVSRYVHPDGNVFQPNNEVSPMSAGAAEQLPPRYSDPDATELSTELLDANKSISFDLQSTKQQSSKKQNPKKR